MIVKVVESTYDSFKDKLKNPFYGTLFIVWIIRNREFIYNVFFNPNCSADERLDIIRNQFLDWNSIKNLLGTIAISLALMILVYASMNLSRFIVEFSERRVKPWIQKQFSTSSIVSREEFHHMEKDRDYFQKKYADERNERIRVQRELNEILERENEKAQKTNQNNDSSDSNVQRTFTVKNDAQVKAKNIISKWKRLRPTYFEDFRILLPNVRRLVRKNQIDSMMKDVGSINEFKKRGIIEEINRNGFMHYNFTEFGDEFVYHIMENTPDKTEEKS